MLSSSSAIRSAQASASALAVAALPVLVFSAALISGCGGSSDPNSYTVGGRTYKVNAATTMEKAEPRLTQAEFRTQAGRFCREAWPTIVDNFAKHTSWQDKSWSDQQRFADAVRKSLIAGITFHIFDNFRRLGSPSGDEEELTEMIGAMQLASEEGVKLRYASIGDVVAQYEEFNRRARAYGGLGDCLVDLTHLRAIAA